MIDKIVSIDINIVCYIYWVIGKSGRLFTFRPEQLHKWERRHTFTQNFKAVSLWFLPLVKCSTISFLINVVHITHTCMQQYHHYIDCSMMKWQKSLLSWLWKKEMSCKTRFNSISSIRSLCYHGWMEMSCKKRLTAIISINVKGLHNECFRDTF